MTMSSENIWEEFDKSVDVEGLQKDIKDAEENGGTAPKARLL